MTWTKARSTPVVSPSPVPSRPADESSATPHDPHARRLVLALGGGAARGLAHIGVLEVLEREGIRPYGIAGSSMGSLIGALSAAGLGAREIHRMAREFRFPAWFFFGRLVRWDAIFPSVARALETLMFDRLAKRLLVSAVDLESGSEVILHGGPVLPAVRASCAVPGVLPPVKLGERWLVDGGVVNVLPVDVAWMMEPDVVLAVNVGGLKAHSLPRLDSPMSRGLSLLGELIPNPATAKASFEMLARAAEITLSHLTVIATAMTEPEVVVEPDLDGIGLRDFDRLDDAVEAGRRAAEAMLPEIFRALDAPTKPSSCTRTIHFDPVCRMVVRPGRARAQATHRGETYYFCSENCRDGFLRMPDRHLSCVAKALADPDIST